MNDNNADNSDRPLTTTTSITTTPSTPAPTKPVRSAIAGANNDNVPAKLNAKLTLNLNMPKLNEQPAADSQPRSHNNNNNNNSNNINSHSNSKNNNATTKPPKKKRRDKSDLGDDFVAPDGGWGWLVSVASGLNTLVTFAVGQNFGIIFRTHMIHLGISNTQMTSIINMQIAISAFTGLLNGPLFRRYSYRQVAIFGSVLTFLGVFIAVFADSFGLYVLGFSCVYGFGRGLLVSASSLAVNTYFKVNRRTATAYQFGVAGLGPIVLPYFATFLLHFYGVQGTVLMFAGLALNTVPFSMIYQPVKWHVKKQDTDAEALQKPLTELESNEIEQVVEPDTPTLARANDGWYGSRVSLNSMRNRLGTWEKQNQAGVQMYELKRLNSKDGIITSKQRSFSTSHSIKEEEVIDEHVFESVHSLEHERYVEHIRAKAELAEHEAEVERRKKLPFYKKIIIFFDLDLLRDITYLNLAVGLTLINFVEINFAILTPFILSDFGFESHQIALAMSILGFCDLVVRFLVPLITANMNFSNRTFFIVGITGMCIGRSILAYTRNFHILIGIFIWLGLNKAFRTVFWSLIIPGYVPLKRLPAAAGLQLLLSGTFSMACGPLIGLIRDSTNYAFTLQFLNLLCVVAISLWLLESAVRSRQRQPKAVDVDMQ